MWELWGGPPDSRGTISGLDFFLKILSYFFLFIVYMSVPMTPQKRGVSPPTMWVLGMGVKLSGLTASTLPY